MPNFLTNDTIRIFLAYVGLVLVMFASLTGLNIIWRARKNFRKFMKYLTAGLIFWVARKIGSVIGLDSSTSWYNIAQILDIISLALIVTCLMEIYNVVRILDHEQPKGD